MRIATIRIRKEEISAGNPGERRCIDIRLGHAEAAYPELRSGTGLLREDGKNAGSKLGSGMRRLPTGLGNAEAAYWARECGGCLLGSGMRRQLTGLGNAEAAYPELRSGTGLLREDGKNAGSKQKNAGN